MRRGRSSNDDLSEQNWTGVAQSFLPPERVIEEAAKIGRVQDLDVAEAMAYLTNNYASMDTMLNGLELELNMLVTGTLGPQQTEEAFQDGIALLQKKRNDIA